MLFINPIYDPDIDDMVTSQLEDDTNIPQLDQLQLNLDKDANTLQINVPQGDPSQADSPHADGSQGDGALFDEAQERS